MARYRNDYFCDYEEICRREYEEMYDDEPYEIGRWATIPGHPHHQASIDGRIRNRYTKRILKGSINQSGYRVVWLEHDRQYLVHRLIIETFYGLPDFEGAQVNHIDCNRLNNHILNLEWVTSSENIKWGVTHGNIDPMKGLIRAREVNIKPVRIVETGQVFASLQDCATFLGVTRGNVSRVLSGERKGQKIHGFTIEYVKKEEM